MLNLAAELSRTPAYLLKVTGRQREPHSLNQYDRYGSLAD